MVGRRERIANSSLVRGLAKKSFAECDLDGDGHIDAKELHVGLLILYDKLNKALPVHMKVPSHDFVQSLLRKHDQDGSQHLTYDEYYECVKTVVGANDSGKITDSLPWMVCSRIALKMLIFPVVALGLKAVLGETPGVGGAVKAIPDGVAAFAVEGMYKVAKVQLSR